MVNPWYMPLLLWSSLNALGDKPACREERWVVLDACVLSSSLLFPLGIQFQVVLLLQGDSR